MVGGGSSGPVEAGSAGCGDDACAGISVEGKEVMGPGESGGGGGCGSLSRGGGGGGGGVWGGWGGGGPEGGVERGGGGGGGVGLFV